tara:strand:- start:1357 stop:1479 length:123 start_codon:yes stop_codon:yes gene_type:complete
MIDGYDLNDDDDDNDNNDDDDDDDDDDIEIRASEAINICL